MLGQFEAKALSTDAIGVRWDAEALGRRGVKRIGLEAQPMNKSLPLLKSEVDASAGATTISGNVIPSTNYSIHVKDAGVGGFEYSIGEIETMPPGGLSRCRFGVTCIRLIFLH